MLICTHKYLHFSFCLKLHLLSFCYSHPIFRKTRSSNYETFDEDGLPLIAEETDHKNPKHKHSKDEGNSPVKAQPPSSKVSEDKGNNSVKPIVGSDGATRTPPVTPRQDDKSSVYVFPLFPGNFCVIFPHINVMILKYF